MAVNGVLSKGGHVCHEALVKGNSPHIVSRPPFVRPSTHADNLLVYISICILQAV